MDSDSVTSVDTEQRAVSVCMKYIRSHTLMDSDSVTSGVMWCDIDSRRLVKQVL